MILLFKRLHSARRAFQTRTDHEGISGSVRFDVLHGLNELYELNGVWYVRSMSLLCVSGQSSE